MSKNSNYAIKLDSFDPVSWRDAKKDGKYKCPECHAQIWFKEGPLRKYFTHRPHDPLVNRCKYYDNIDKNPIEPKINHIVNHQTEIAICYKELCDYCLDNGRNVPRLAINTLKHYDIQMDCSMNICNECHDIPQTILYEIPKRLCVSCKVIEIDKSLPHWKVNCDNCFKKMKAPRNDDVELPCITCKEYFMRHKNETWRSNCLSCYKKKMNY